MILAFTEDGSVFVFTKQEDACREFEGIDVENGVVTFYDDAGTPLRPDFIEPNQQGRSFFIRWVVSGKYRLVRDPYTEQDPFWLALHESSHLEPNSEFEILDDLKRHVAAKGAVVDPPDSSD